MSTELKGNNGRAWDWLTRILLVGLTGFVTWWVVQSSNRATSAQAAAERVEERSRESEIRIRVLETKLDTVITTVEELRREAKKP